VSKLQGPVGLPGFNGSQEPIGPAGPPGFNGTQGPQGIMGPRRLTAHRELKVQLDHRVPKEQETFLSVYTRTKHTKEANKK